MGIFRPARPLDQGQPVEPVERHQPVERVALVVGAALVVSGLVHLGLLLVDGSIWTGPVSWRKPATFGLSFGLTLVTITWVASLVHLGRRARTTVVGALTVACVLEVTLITVQAWRGVPSHFNLSTSADALVARTLAVGGGVLVAVFAALTVAALRPPPPGVDRATTLAVRAGLLALDAGLLLGAVMIALGVATAAGGDQAGAYTVGGVFKPAHFVTLHGVLVLPVLARALAGHDRQWPLVRLAVTGYAALCVLVTAGCAAVALT